MNSPSDTSPYTPPQTPTERSATFNIVKAPLVLILTVAISASSILMVGPPIVLILPLAVVLGLVSALERSFWSLVCFGYPLTFGLISAWIGYTEMPGYKRSPAFVVSIGIGLIGCALIATGLWKVFHSRQGTTSCGNTE
jgi:hypothetical protein